MNRSFESRNIESVVQTCFLYIYTSGWVSSSVITFVNLHRPFTTPRVLGGSPEPSDDEEEEDGENEDDPTQKESIAKSQDGQVDKSLVNRRQRGRGHERKGPKKDEANKEGQKGGTRGRGRGVSASESKQRAHNERNKGTRANHNRKAGAAVKRNKGMGMLPSR